MFSAWALEVAPIKGVVSIVSPWVHLFLFSCFDLVFRFTTLHDTPLSLTLIISTCYCILSNSSDLQEELLHINF